MKMEHKKFVKIAASLGISTFLLAGCTSDDEEQDFSNVNQNQDIDGKQCLSESQNQDKECFESLPQEGPINKTVSNFNDQTYIDNGMSFGAAIFPFAAGYMLANMGNRSNGFGNGKMFDRPGANNFTPLMKNQSPWNPALYYEKEKEKDSSSGRAGGGGAGTVTSSNDKKVDLNKSTNSSSNSTETTTKGNQPSTHGATTPNGSSGIGNSKAPAGS
ncbi:TPA: hypothetical protein ROX88_002277 [Bacillus pseudomycoides]|nr:hypothetical protein [Bacillus pseudomycoides]